MCAFCAIAQKGLPAHIVYEDEQAMAFLDSDPVAEGHMLVIPKAHYRDLDDMPAETAAHIARVAQQLVGALKRVYRPQGYSLLQNGGRFNDIGHFHCHIIPRNEGDGFGWRDDGQAHRVDESIARRIRENIG